MSAHQDLIDELRRLADQLDSHAAADGGLMEELDHCVRQLAEHLHTRRFRIVSDILLCQQGVFAASNPESRAITAAIEIPRGIGISIWTDVWISEVGLAGNPSHTFVPLHGVPLELRKSILPLLPSLVRSFVDNLSRPTDNGR